MGSVTVSPMRSIGSPLDLRIKREARKSKAFLHSATVSRFDSEKDKGTEQMSLKNDNITALKSEAENVEDLSDWLKNMTNIDTCGRTVEQVEGIKVGVLPSSVSKDAERFDQMSVVDDELYTYTGEKCNKKLGRAMPRSAQAEDNVA